ncbi:toll-like receptor 4 [Dreissena polymorpha]|nr:toll-like receptor 4 [Dreissena polymorpha]
MDCEGRGNLKLSEICVSIGNMTSLKAGRNNFGNLTALDLKGCENLAEIYFNFNQIAHIEREIFQDFRHLHLLDLSRNLLQVYFKGWDASFLPKNLHTLKINGNPIPDNANFPNLDSQYYLNKLISDGVSNKALNVSRLAYLSLSGLNLQTTCQLIRINNETFSLSNSLKVLNISDCGVISITAGAFEHLHSLEVLDLSYNRQLELWSLVNITYGLQFTRIRFLNISNLVSRFSSGKQIKLPHTCYLWNTTVEDVDLSGNMIDMVETNSFILTPPSLQILRINQNKFRFGPYVLQFGCLGNVTAVFLSYQNHGYNPLIYVAENSKRYSGPTEELYQMECPFCNVSFLKEYANRTRDCTFIENGVLDLFHLKLPVRMERIIANDCALTFKINYKYYFNPENSSMRYVDISGNIVESFTGYIGNLPMLETLNMSRCYTSSIGQTSLNYISLKTLRLAHNDIGAQLADSKRSNIFNMLPSLQDLDLSSNGITVLFTSTFKELVNLRHLDLSNNNIEHFDVNINTLSHLLQLNLEINSIHTLKKEVRRKLEANENDRSKFSINLQKNSLTYDCNNQEFLHWLIQHKANMVGFRGYIFISSDEKSITCDKMMTDLDRLESRCKSYVAVIIVGVLALATFLSLIIGGVIYRYRWRIRYFMYMSKKRFFGYHILPDYTVIQNYKYDAFVSYAEDNIRFILDDVIP